MTGNHGRSRGHGESRGDGRTTQLVASPHAFDRVYYNDRSGVRAGVQALQTELNTQGIPLKILPAMENRVHPELLAHYRLGEVQTVNDSRYILIELPYSQIPLYTEHVLFSLLAEGLVPVVVHPERTKPIQTDPNILGRLVESGVLALFSADSLDKDAGHGVRQAVHTMLTHHLVLGVASDAHDSRRRLPGIGEACQAMARILKLKELPGWMATVPEKIIHDQEVERPEPRTIEKTKGFFRR